MKIDDLTWLLTIGSLIGGQLVIFKNKNGYGIWIVVNTIWMAFFVYKNMPSSAALFFVYLVQSIYGFSKWKGKDVS